MKYIITIKDTHIVDGDKESSELITTGNVTFNDKGYKVRYKESGEGYEGCFVTLSFEKNKVIMTRSGVLVTEMIMEKGKRHTCAYATPVGIMDLGVYTDEVESTVSKDGGRLKFSYTLSAGGEFLSENKLIVEWRKSSDN